MLHHLNLIKRDISAQDKLLVLWIPSFLAFNTFLKSYEHTFPRSWVQFVFLDMIVG